MGGVGPVQHPGASQAPPPTLGHGPNGLFGSIMANQSGQGGPGLAPPTQDQQQPAQHQMPQPMPGAQPQGPPPPTQQAPFPNYPPGGSLNGKSLVV